MDNQYTSDSFPATAVPVTFYSPMPMGAAGCPFYPWVQCPNALADPPVHADQPRQGPPTGPPPNFIPTEQPVPFAIDPGAISRCLFRFTYIWLRNRQEFWFFPVFLGRTSIAGWRYDERRRRWSFFGVDLREIRSFQCF